MSMIIIAADVEPNYDLPSFIEMAPTRRGKSTALPPRKVFREMVDCLDRAARRGIGDCNKNFRQKVSADARQACHTSVHEGLVEAADSMFNAVRTVSTITIPEVSMHNTNPVRLIRQRTARKKAVTKINEVFRESVDRGRKAGIDSCGERIILADRTGKGAGRPKSPSKRISVCKAVVNNAIDSAGYCSMGRLRLAGMLPSSD